MALEKYLRNPTEETENSQNVFKKQTEELVHPYQNAHIWEARLSRGKR